MWVFSDVGFFSVVEDWKDKQYVWVRARWKKDLIQLRSFIRKEKMRFKFGSIKETPERDYPFRVRLKKNNWVMALHCLGENINYGNFKGAVQDQDPAREQVYMKVWSILRNAASPEKKNEPWEGEDL